MLYGRPNLTAVSLGIHQAILDETIRSARERQRYGEPLAEAADDQAEAGRACSRG